MNNAPVPSPACQFSLGQVHATPAALRQLGPGDITRALRRHSIGDWGDLVESDRTENERALEDSGRLFSVYHARDGTKFWVITEADRNLTTVLLPADY